MEPVNNNPAFIRTAVPMIVGYLSSWLVRQGFDINDDMLSAVITAVAGFLYFAVAKWLETHKHSKFGWLLGSSKVPVYTTPPSITTDAAGDVQVLEKPEDDGVPEQTDNTPRLVDGEQSEVSQNPEVIYDEEI